MDGFGLITRMGSLVEEDLKVAWRSGNGLAAGPAKADKVRAWLGCEAVSQGGAVMVMVRIYVLEWEGGIRLECVMQGKRPGLGGRCLVLVLVLSLTCCVILGTSLSLSGLREKWWNWTRRSPRILTGSHDKRR